MLHDSITLVPNAEVKNFKIASAPTLPTDPFEGQSLILTAQQGEHTPGGYTYVNGVWEPNGDITAVIAGNGLTGGGAAGAIGLAIDTTVVALKSDLVGLGGGGTGGNTVSAGNGLKETVVGNNVELSIDTSKVALKSDIPAATNLSEYQTKVQADIAYAKKSDIPDVLITDCSNTSPLSESVVGPFRQVLNGNKFEFRSIRSSNGSVKVGTNGAEDITLDIDFTTVEAKQTQGFGLKKVSTEVSVAAAATPYDIESSVYGIPAAGAIVMLPFKFTRTVKFPNNFAGSVAQSIQAATVSSAFELYKNGAQVGTFTFAANSNAGVFASVGGTEIVFSVGDVLIIKAPAVKDVTLANISYTLCGNLQTV